MTRQDIYGEEWEVEDEEGEGKYRWYIHPIYGRFVSVTTALDSVQPPKLINYFKNTSAKKIKETSTRTAGLGTLLHQLMEDDLNHKSVDVPAEALKAFSKWKELVEKHRISAKFQERVVFSKKYGFAGSPDIIGTYEDIPSVMDKKTGFYGVKASWQMALYKLAYEEMAGVTGTGLVGLQIKQDGSSASSFVVQHPEWCELMGLSALTAWKGLNFYKLQKMNWPWLFVHPLVAA